MFTSDGERIARLEGIIEELRNRMTAIENRMNVQIGLNVAMWVSIVGLLVTIILRQ